MSNNPYEDVPFLSSDADPLEEKHDVSTDLVRHRRGFYCVQKAASTALFSLFMAVVLVLTVIVIATQKIPIATQNGPSAPSQQILQNLDLPLDATLTPKVLDGDLYDFPRLGNVVLKTPGCGDSPEEAKALGCVFDPMNWHWIRPECFYKEGSDYAQTNGPWTYYRYSNFTGQLNLPDANAMSTVREVYTDHSWHVHHCVYSLKSLHRAAMMDKWIPEEVASWPHSLHCMKVFEMMGTPPKTLNTRINMQFLACVKFESRED